MTEQNGGASPYGSDAPTSGQANTDGFTAPIPQRPSAAPLHSAAAGSGDEQASDHPTESISRDPHPTQPMHEWWNERSAENADADPQSSNPGRHATDSGQPQYGQYAAAPYGAPAHPGSEPNYPSGQPYGQGTNGGLYGGTRTKEKKRVGAGVFVAAATGTSLALAGQNNGTGTVQTQQSAPLIVNNQDDVNVVTAAAQKASPSVVTISATSGTSGGTGSGIILDNDGHILTNTHVVTLDGAAANATLEVRTSDNKVYSAKIVGTDPMSDLAVIKVDATGLVPATLGDSSNINVGDTVIAIGAPLGLSGTVTDGIVSTLNRTIQVASSAVPDSGSDSSQGSQGGNGFNFAPPDGSNGTSSAATGTINLNVIQTDAAINPGNSGGALTNTDGAIIGVNVAIASAGSSSSSTSQSGNIGVGFSVPINTAKRVAQEIIANGSATHGQLGVSVKPQAGGTGSSSSTFSVGAAIAEVTAGSPAEKAGLQVGDVVTNFGSRTITDASELTAAVREQAGGATVKVTFQRNGKEQSVDVTLGTASLG
jgi:putative serine protease PepD